jgi:hypothetical protein
MIMFGEPRTTAWQDVPFHVADRRRSASDLGERWAKTRIFRVALHWWFPITSAMQPTHQRQHAWFRRAILLGFLLGAAALSSGCWPWHREHDGYYDHDGRWHRY